MASTERTLIVIGGGEDRSGDKVILGEVARRVGAGKLVVKTVAMNNPAISSRRTSARRVACGAGAWSLGLRRAAQVGMGMVPRGDHLPPDVCAWPTAFRYAT